MAVRFVRKAHKWSLNVQTWMQELQMLNAWTHTEGSLNVASVNIYTPNGLCKNESVAIALCTGIIRCPDPDYNPRLWVPNSDIPATIIFPQGVFNPQSLRLI